MIDVSPSHPIEGFGGVDTSLSNAQRHHSEYNPGSVGFS
jgi:hypothetical protein